MGNCCSCFKVPPPSPTTDPSAVPEIKEGKRLIQKNCPKLKAAQLNKYELLFINSIFIADTMEMRRLFPSHQCTMGPLTSIDSRANGNKKPATNLSGLNNVGSDNCGSVPVVQNNLRLSRAFYARLPPLGRSTTANSGNATGESNKQQREPSEAKLNGLFDQYKVMGFLFYCKQLNEKISSVILLHCHFLTGETCCANVVNLAFTKSGGLIFSLCMRIIQLGFIQSREHDELFNSLFWLSSC